jgi:PAS domain S-box-containing protein
MDFKYFGLEPILNDFLRSLFFVLISSIIAFTRKRELDIESKLEENLLRLETLYNNLAAGILILDSDYKIIDLNPIMAEMLGFTKEELMGTSITNITFPEDLEITIMNLENLTSGRNDTYNIEKRYMQKDKKVFWGNLSVSVLRNENREIQSITGVIVDITPRKQAEESLYKANEQLKEADKLKSIFLSSMSHELRTPLNSIIGFTGILLQGLAGDLNEEQKKQLGIIKKSSQHLLSLINDILDISKIEAGKLELDCEHFDLKEVMEEIILTFDAIAKDKNLEIKKSIPKNIILYNDKRRFKQILLNIVSNAIKYTNEGSVRITVNILDNKELEIKILDTGVGIKREDLNRIFEPFQQVDEELTKKVEGTGLGLHLVRKLLSIMNGNISLVSEYGKGSIFTIIMPLKVEGNRYEKNINN